MIGSLFFVIFLILYLIDKRRLTNYFFLFISLGFFLIEIVLIIVFIGGGFVATIVAIALILCIIVIPFLLLASGIALVFNGTVLIKNEGKRFHNLLSLLVGVGIILLICLVIAFPLLVGYGIIKPTFFLGMSLLLIYFLLLFVIFFIASFVYNLNYPMRNKDFIIILGCGLIKDKVPPLLASRIDLGIKFYNEQKKKRQKIAPKFIVSGGQGADEIISEAQAMKLYLLDKGIVEEDIIMEDKSTNTYENMKFSKLKMDALKKKYKCIFVTNNFHLFRAGIYAKKAKLRCDGIGAKTALYYLPNAFIREFIAILVIHKKTNIFIASIVFILSMIFVFI